MTITIGEKTTKVPQSWNELPLNKQLECYHIIMGNKHSFFEASEIMPATRILLATRLLGLPSSQIKAWQADCQQHDPEDGELLFLAELEAILKCTDFLFEQQSNKEDVQLYSINLSLTKCPWSRLKQSSKGKRKKYLYGPADGLANLNLFELSIAFTTFEAYLKNPSEDLVHKLLAILYRPAKPKTKINKRAKYHGDKRQALYQHEHLIPKRAIIMRSLPREVKQLLLFWFASCRHQIIISFPNVFKAPQGERVGNDYGWGGVLLSLAGGIVHLDKVAQRPYPDALVYLSYLEDQRKGRERKIKK